MEAKHKDKDKVKDKDKEVDQNRGENDTTKSSPGEHGSQRQRQ